MLEQESRKSIGGQAFWSFGGLFLVNSKVQKLFGVKDSYELAMNDWFKSASFDRDNNEDYWAKKWAEAYVYFATYEKENYLKQMGIKITPILGWAERGGSSAASHGNSVPRFHVTWGTGPGLIQPFIDYVLTQEKLGNFCLLTRHRVTDIQIKKNRITGVSGDILEDDTSECGEPSSKEVVDNFKFNVDCLLIATGGIGANMDLIKKNWPKRLGAPPKKMIQGVPNSIDGKMIELAETKGINVVNKDRMWHYTEGIQNYDSIWSNHGIRIIPGPSSIWLNAKGERMYSPDYPGFDTLHTLKTILSTGYDYSWFILTEDIIKKEFVLSGSEQNPDLTTKDLKLLIKERLINKETGPIKNFLKYGDDFIVANDLKTLVDKMNSKTENSLLSYDKIRKEIVSRDLQLNNRFTKDAQVTFINNFRKFLGDKVFRVAKPHKFLGSKNKLIAVKLNIISRKTLGGIQTNLDGQVYNNNSIIKGLYASGEASGFGGGGLHGYRSLEGTFLGGCIFSGIKAADGIIKYY